MYGIDIEIYDHNGKYLRSEMHDEVFEHFSDAQRELLQPTKVRRIAYTPDGHRLILSDWDYNYILTIVEL